MRTAEKQVCHVVRYVSHYRADFYELVRAGLAEHGVRYRLLAGSGWAGEQPVGGIITLPWAEPLPTRLLSVAGRQLLVQSPIGLRGADLIVLEQQSKATINLFALAARFLRGKKVAFIGHGRNLQATDPNAIEEKWKAWMTRHADWFFGYTEKSVEIAVEHGIDRTHTSVLNNGLDVDKRRTWAAESERRASEIRTELGLGSGPVAVYSGRIYELKRPDFLIEAGRRLSESIEGFHLVIVGEGPADGVVRRAAEREDWLHFVGPRYDVDLDAHLRLGSVILMPGLVGLVAVDSFIVGVPLVTTEQAYHSPEFDYLDDQNALILPATICPAEVRSLLEDPGRLGQLATNASAAADCFTTHAMARRFVGDIIQIFEGT